MRERLGSVLRMVVLTLVAASLAVNADAVEQPIADLDYAQVQYVKAVQSSDGSWCISATVRHNDEGVEHYANAWQVLDEAGNELGWRLLAHPHDDEQPFTREQCDIEIPAKISKIIVRAKCKVHGFGGQPVLVDLSRGEGENYKVTREKP